MRRHAASERGDIVLGWLTRVVVTLAVVAVIAFDSIAIVTAHFSLSDDAQSAAEAANAAWNEHRGNVQDAYNAAAAYAEQHGEELPVKDFTVTPTGVVQVELTRKAATLVVGHLGPLKKLAEIHGTGQATTPSQ
jgi:hypothetical protein